MDTEALFLALASANERPAAWSVYTAEDLWTDRHTSERMLAFHLDGDVDVSSRRTEFIDESVRWMSERFALQAASRVIDFGCGPGLYTSRFARLGADVCGVDFSTRSIAFARAYAERKKLEISYATADYLSYEPSGPFDLITMIMCDFCALSPGQRATMLNKFREALGDGGHVVLDVYSLNAFSDKQEASFFEKNQLDGFWAAEPYYALVGSHKYPEHHVSLDKYTIIERHRQRTVYNWLQYFSPESLAQEVNAAGLAIAEIYGDVAGASFDSEAAEFAVVLTRQP